MACSFSELFIICWIYYTYVALLHQKSIVIQSGRELQMYRQFCMIACELRTQIPRCQYISSLCRSQNSLGNVIRRHKNDIFRTDDVYRITVRRSHVFEDAIKAFNAATVSLLEEKPLKVVFYGEPAIDYGGPTREFFTLLLKSIASNATILDGTENRRVLRHNTTAFQVSAYFVHDCVYCNQKGLWN